MDNYVIREKLEDIKFSAAEKYVFYKYQMKPLIIIRNVLLILNISIPVVSVFLLYTFKGTDRENVFNYITFILSISLFILTTLSIAFKVDEKIVEHRNAIDEYIYIKNKADYYIDSNDTDSLNWFFDSVAKLDAKAFSTLNYTTDKKRQKIYRDTVKEYKRNDARCATCNTLVWFLKKGDNVCGTCGNSIDNEEMKESKNGKKSRKKI